MPVHCETFRQKEPLVTLDFIHDITSFLLLNSEVRHLASMDDWNT